MRAYQQPMPQPTPYGGIGLGLSGVGPMGPSAGIAGQSMMGTPMGTGGPFPGLGGMGMGGMGMGGMGMAGMGRGGMHGMGNMGMGGMSGMGMGQIGMDRGMMGGMTPGMGLVSFPHLRVISLFPLLLTLLCSFIDLSRLNVWSQGRIPHVPSACVLDSCKMIATPFLMSSCSPCS